MTREEAKKRLEVWQICGECPEDKQCYDSHLHSICEYDAYCDEVSISEAVKVAIKALEQERIRSAEITQYRHDCEKLMEENERLKKAIEQEPCTDAISRADVKKYLSAPNENGDRVIYESDLDLLPPVTPKSKTGHWIATEKDWWKCSECGQVIYSETEQDRREYHAYCGRCGAKMLPTSSKKGVRI